MSIEKGWRKGLKLAAPKVVFSAMVVNEEEKTYIVREIIMSERLGDLMLDMPPGLIKQIYEMCMNREKNGYKPIER